MYCLIAIQARRELPFSSIDNSEQFNALHTSIWFKNVNRSSRF